MQSVLSTGCVTASKGNMQRTKQDRSRKVSGTVFVPQQKWDKCQFIHSPASSGVFSTFLSCTNLRNENISFMKFEDFPRVSSTHMD